MPWRFRQPLRRGTWFTWVRRYRSSEGEVKGIMDRGRVTGTGGRAEMNGRTGETARRGSGETGRKAGGRKGRPSAVSAQPSGSEYREKERGAILDRTSRQTPTRFGAAQPLVRGGNVGHEGERLGRAFDLWGRGLEKRVPDEDAPDLLAVV
jgi:hypothetical protein